MTLNPTNNTPAKVLGSLKKKRLFRDSFWAVAGNFAGKGLSVVAGLYVAKLLGSGSYGELGMLKTTLTNVTMLSTFGLGYSATRYIADCCGRDSRGVKEIHDVVVSTVIVVSLAMAFMLALFAQPLADFMDVPDSAYLFRITALSVVFSSLAVVQSGELGGFKAYREIARNTFIGGLVTFLTSIGFAMAWGVVGVLYSICLSSVVSCLLNAMSLKKHYGHYGLSFGFNRSRFRSVISFALPIALQDGIYTIFSWAMTFLLVKMADYDQLGISSVASLWYNMMLFIPGSLNNVALSHISSERGRGRDRLVSTMVMINGVASLIPAVGVCVFSGLIERWYGASYAGLQSVLVLSVSAAVMASIARVLYNEMLVEGRGWFVVATLVSLHILDLLGAYLLIRFTGRGAFSVQLAFLATQVIYVVVMGVSYLTLRSHRASSGG